MSVEGLESLTGGAISGESERVGFFAKNGSLTGDCLTRLSLVLVSSSSSVVVIGIEVEAGVAEVFCGLAGGC